MEKGIIMNVIFLTLSRITNIRDRGIYTDLLRKFRDEGHSVFVVCPFERRLGKKTRLYESDGVKILGVKVLNIQKTNWVEKGLGTVLLESQYMRAVRHYLKAETFDLILYSTPPITLAGVVGRLKKRNPRARTYLLLKDIFPQNAVDLEMLKEGGLLHRYFRRKEKELYRLSDYIGCMSPANVEFLLRHNPEIAPCKVELAPNSVDPESAVFADDRDAVRREFGLPVNKPIFIYGGNLGKPQGIDFLIACLEANRTRTDCYFMVIGTGTEYDKLNRWYAAGEHPNMRLCPGMPKADYDRLVRSCDVGLIFLDHRFLIPNYPSRLLSYMEYKMPVLAATDVCTDIGSIAQVNGYGFWCESTDVAAFTALVDRYVFHPEMIRPMGECAYRFLLENYLVDHTYGKIVSHW